MKSESIDTNVILRYILADNMDQFERASKLLNRSNIKYRATDAVLTEVIHVLESFYSLPRSYIREQIMDFLSIESIVSNSELNIPIALSLYANRPKLSFVDCYLAVEAEYQKSTPLWTFDKKLAQQSSVAKELPS